MTSLSYESAKQLSQSSDSADRRRVAADPATVPELLYYLTDDQDAAVRRDVASNSSTPRQADLKLTDDHDEEVRTALASKIAQLVPGLPKEAQNKASQLTLEVLRKLAHDEAIRVREVLSDALQSIPNAPRDVINLLARDVELRVAEPVLRYSPVLSDDDLLDIIKAGPIPGALTAIASRANLTDTLSNSIASLPDVAAVAALLGNSSARIREDTLDRLLERAPQQPEWHEPLVRRPRLPLAAIRRLAQFVTTQLLEVLRQQPDIDPATASDVAELVRTRLSQASQEEERPTERAERLHKTNALDEPTLTTALEAGERSFLITALALKAGTDSSTVSRILSAHSAKGVTALAWKAGLSMRLALQLQTRLSGIAPQQALYPKEGTSYPLSEPDLKWQLEFFGIPC